MDRTPHVLKTAWGETVADALPELARLGSPMLGETLNAAGVPHTSPGDALLRELSAESCAALGAVVARMLANGLAERPLYEVIPSIGTLSVQARRSWNEAQQERAARIVVAEQLAVHSFRSLASAVALDDESTILLLARLITAELEALGEAAERRDAVVTAERVASKIGLDEQHAACELLEGFNERALRCLRTRTFALGAPLRLDDLALEQGVTRERIRQIEAGALRKIGHRLKRAVHESTRARADVVRRRLGVAFPLSAAQLMFPELAVDDMSLITDEWLLLLWAAGPYRLHKGWLVTGAHSELVATTRAALNARCNGQPKDATEVMPTMVELGIASGVTAEWITHCGKFRIARGKIYPWHGSALDKIRMLLLLEGQPMDISAILAGLDEDYNRRAITSRLIEDARFIRLSPRRFGLREWGGKAYVSINQAIREELARRGGAVSLVDLEILISEAYGVARSSVSAYAGSHQFQVVDGIVSLAPAGDATVRCRPLLSCARCYDIAGRPAFRLRVASDELRGSGRFLPKAFGLAIGVTPATTQSFESRYGPMTVTWPGLQPQLSSVRYILRRLRLTHGDHLFVFCPEPGKLRFVPLRQQELISRPPFERIALLVGVPKRELATSNLARKVARRLGGSGSGNPLIEISMRLDDRRERDLRELMKGE